MAPEISVIVPIYNVGTFAVQAVQSLLDQSFTDFEALLVDDGSTDGSGRAALAAAAGDRRFRLITQANQGLSAARNRALDQAQGQLIAFLDGDDRFAPEFLSRMRAALQADGGDWVACGLADCWPDGRCLPQSALYDQPMPAAAARWPLQSASQILSHYPSAWNKLYRRSLIGDLRFEEGTWFEDHAFYQQLALRAGALLHLPEALYLQTRGRDGQITTSDDERIFDQFAVLDRLRGVLNGAGLPDTPEAFAAFASRLLAERAPVLRDPDRRQRWLRHAGEWLGRRGIRFHKAASPSLALALAGRAAVGVVLDLTGGARLSQTTLSALADQDIAAFTLTVVRTAGLQAATDPLAALRQHCPDRPLLDIEVPAGTSRAGIWAAALDAPEGPGRTSPEALVLAGPGDGFERAALRLWADALGRSGAGVAVSGCLTPGAGHWHDGWGDPAALSQPPAEGLLLRPDPARLPFLPLPCAQLITRQALAAALPAVQRSPWPEAALARALAAQGTPAVWLAFPGARPGVQPGLARFGPLAAFARSLASAAVPGLQRQMLLRALQMQMEFATPPGRPARLRAALRLRLQLIRLRLAGRLRGPGPLDPRLHPLLRQAAMQQAGMQQAGMRLQ